MKKKCLFILIFVLIFSIFDFVSAQEQVEIDFFYSPTCPYCIKEGKFLSELEKEYPEIKINRMVSFENIELLREFYQKYEVPKREQGLVPITFTQERYFLGFNEEIGKQIEACIKDCLAGSANKEKNENMISLPVLGKIDPGRYSLAGLAVVLGFFDGFNVCSLGALVLILGLVLILRSRKKIMLFGGLFILVTAVVYGLLILLWYQLFALLAPYLRAMEIFIGLLGVGGGIYFLREFIRMRRQGAVCEPGKNNSIISKFSSKIQTAFKDNKSILALVLGILLFAAVITIVEFPCSAAVPVFFAGALAQAQLPAISYLFYIALFLLLYMIDEIIVFLIAIFTMNIKLASFKFTTYITLIEAVVLFALGIYYLFGFLIL